MSLKKIITVLCVPLIFSVLVLLIYDIHRLYANGRTILPYFGVLIGFINPPDDYFLSRGKVSLQPNENEYIIEYTHKYYGGYIVEIRFPGEIEVTEKIKTGLSFDCLYYDADGCLIRNAYVRNLICRSNGRGSILGVIDKYDVPKDLSIFGKWKLIIRSDGDIEDFVKRNSDSVLRIVKSSDE